MLHQSMIDSLSSLTVDCLEAVNDLLRSALRIIPVQPIGAGRTPTGKFAALLYNRFGTCTWKYSDTYMHNVMYVQIDGQ